jgi:hypothetical protein
LISLISGKLARSIRDRITYPFSRGSNTPPVASGVSVTEPSSSANVANSSCAIHPARSPHGFAGVTAGSAEFFITRWCKYQHAVLRGPTHAQGMDIDISCQVSKRLVSRDPRRAPAWAHSRCDVLLNDSNDADKSNRGFARISGRLQTTPDCRACLPRYKRIRRDSRLGL